MTQTKNILLLPVAGIIFCISIFMPLNAQTHRKTLNKNKILDGCSMLIESYPQSANIGNFTNGYSGPDIPGTGGETNYIEFTIYDDEQNDITVNLNFSNAPDNNNLTIDGWTYDFMDYDSPTTWYDRRFNVKQVTRVTKLVHNQNDACQSWAKSRITLNHISVRPDAVAGSATMTVTISATEN